MEKFWLADFFHCVHRLYLNVMLNQAGFGYHNFGLLLFLPFRSKIHFMKKFIAIISILFLCAFTPAGNVYVCVSNTSVAYHSNRNCTGLSRCTHEIKAMSIDDAVKMGKRQCHICYK